MTSSRTKSCSIRLTSTPAAVTVNGERKVFRFYLMTCATHQIYGKAFKSKVRREQYLNTHTKENQS